MNDPHVEALVYRIRHKESVDYSETVALDFATSDFDVRVADGVARFTMAEHFSTAEAARAVVDPFVQDWEFEACLRYEPDRFELEYDFAAIVDRKPTPWVIEVAARPVRFEFSIPEARVTVEPGAYPSRPCGIDSNAPDVQVLLERYKRYRAGGEHRTSFSYFCLTALEQSPSSRGKPSGRRQAAEWLGVDFEVLQRIGELSSTKGGHIARKYEGRDQPLAADEERFLDAALRLLIRRLAERAADEHGALPKIRLEDFDHG